MRKLAEAQGRPVTAEKGETWQHCRMQVALDLLALRAFLHRVGSAEDWEPTWSCCSWGASLYVPPIVAEERASAICAVLQQNCKPFQILRLPFD